MMSSVCLSFCPFVALCIVALRVGVVRVQTVKSCTVVFLTGNFLFTYSYTFALKNESTTIRHVDAAGACDVVLTKLGPPQRYRTDATTASSRRLSSSAIPYVVRTS